LLKSTAWLALVERSEWFADSMPNLQNKDAVHHVLGPWIIEIAELEALRKSSTPTVKAFLSRAVDRVRLSYARMTTNHPRHIVFVGSTNDSAYNADPTGGRRFWPFRVYQKPDVEGIERDRDQLWAEAVHRYKQGHPWWLSAELEQLAREQQRERFKASPWHEAVREYAEGKSSKPGHVEIRDVLERAIGLPIRDQDQKAVNEVVRCLTHMGWRRTQIRADDGTRPRVYVPPLLEPSQVSPAATSASCDAKGRR
jgi:predicted P-loop ATPase